MGTPAFTQGPPDSGATDPLTELALDLRCSWNHAADALWEKIDPELWSLTNNPWVVLQTASPRKLQAALADPAFRDKLERVLAEKREVEVGSAWFQEQHAGAPLTAVAYFSMEFMLSEALPIYSGGLGNVAGDQLKAASDLGVPVAGVGLLYQQGYFRQMIDAHGVQHALYPFNDPGQLPITPVRDEHGEWLRLPVNLPGFRIWIRTWQAQVGRRRLYLLDSNDPANLPEYRGITSELYGGGPELRLMQEIVLGICGWRLLRALGQHPEVCHLNEGHAAFAVLERAHSYMLDSGEPFAVALAVTRAGNVFTTHTPVEAGFDRFAPELVEKYLRFYAERELRISMEELLALGRRNPGDRSEPFNMAYLALRGSGAANGVSRLHGEVSRRIFQPLFPRWPSEEVPVGYVTNGVHTPTWDSSAADQLWTETCGKERWNGSLQGVDEALRAAPDERLWEMRGQARRELVEYVRKRLARQMATQGAPGHDRAQAARIFDPNTLTLGFARRFAEYKRPNLLLHDRERLARILCDRERPVQLVVAGKAHPQDSGGQAMIREWNDFVRRADVRLHATFLADYDTLLATHMVEGVDVWINTPRRPWEASGTSGMKTLVNGGLNLSELDGWWAEAYTPEVGWGLGDGREHDSDPAWDAAEAEALYRLLEQEVVPEFYTRDAHGVPTGWVQRMRESMARLTPQFSANRAVREYTEGYYLRAAAAFERRAQQQSAVAKDLLRWHEELAQHWGAVRFGAVTVKSEDGWWTFEAQVYLDDLHPDSVQVELYAEGREAEPPLHHPMERGPELVGSVRGYAYSARVAASRPAEDLTPRIVPFHADAFVPLEANQILWQR
jgi:starch phosphorylase